MSDQASRPALPGPADRATEAARVVREVEQWRRRSRLIHFFRKALPVAIVLVLLLMFGWMGLKYFMANLPNLAAQGAEIRMINPRFYGQDERGQSFVLGAKEARREAGGRQLIRLFTPLLKLSTGPNRTLQISGAAGVYDQLAHAAKVEGGVKLSDTGSGYSFDTDRAFIDTKTADVTGDKAVAGRGPIGEISASSYGIYNRGGHMVFAGNVRTRIYQTGQVAR